MASLAIAKHGNILDTRYVTGQGSLLDGKPCSRKSSVSLACLCGLLGMKTQ
jgi:hypothetical protein